MPNPLRQWYLSDDRLILRHEVRWAVRWLWPLRGIMLVLLMVGLNYTQPMIAERLFAPLLRGATRVTTRLIFLINMIDTCFRMLPMLIWLVLFRIRVLPFLEQEVRTGELHLTKIRPRHVWPAKFFGPIVITMTLMALGSLATYAWMLWITPFESRIGQYHTIYFRLDPAPHPDGWWMLFFSFQDFVNRFLPLISSYFCLMFFSCFMVIRLFRNPDPVRLILWFAILIAGLTLLNFVIAWADINLQMRTGIGANPSALQMQKIFRLRHIYAPLIKTLPSLILFIVLAHFSMRALRRKGLPRSPELEGATHA